MITDRQKEMLKIIAEEYIKTAKPVSSNHILKNYNVLVLPLETKWLN